MFKLQRKFQSMDINKNTEKYKFNPGYSTFNSYNEKPISNIRESSYNRTNKFQPLYFYRKVNTPYKYSITSVPKYLIKTNEEKRFMDKLYKSLNEKDKNILNDFLNKKKSKDNFKPQYIEVQKLLNYKPKLFSNVNDHMMLKKNNDLNNNQAYFDYKNQNKNKCNNENDLNVNHINNDDAGLENKEIDEKEKLKNSDGKNVINNDEISEEEQIKYKYKLSDIFNLRREPVFTNKSAEKHLFKKNKNNIFINTCPNFSIKNEKEEKENKFYTSSESKSDWIPNKINKKKMGTNSSVAYNILCPMYSGTNRFITATELNKNNLYNESPAYRRVKSISEFIDLTRVSATNTLGCFERNMKIPNFRFNNNIGTNQLNAYHINKDLIEKPI